MQEYHAQDEEDCSDPLLAMLLDSQSRPSYRPSPEVAHVLWMYLQVGARDCLYDSAFA